MRAAAPRGRHDGLPHARLNRISRRGFTMSILLKNPPFILREPQDERKSG